MCGINGLVHRDKSLIQKMMTFTKNRGLMRTTFSNENVTIGHDRLSILDLNDRSNQPFLYKNLVLSFNGEIFNYLDLKRFSKQGYAFKPHQCRVIIYYFINMELTHLKNYLIFAISIWDNQKSLYLIRDIVGVKPLYYHETKNNDIIYSSSINSILSTDQKFDLNERALFYYENVGRNEGAETFKGIFKLLPGELLIKEKNKDKKNLNF